VLEFNVTAANTDTELNLATLASNDATNGPAILTVLSKVSRMNNCLVLQSARASEGAFATGNATITNVANLISGADDAIEVAGVSFVAQAGAAVLGAATFQAVTDVHTTAVSLAAQINAHATTSPLVTATVAAAPSGVCTITAKTRGVHGNAITISYTDNDANIGATVSGAVLAGGTPTAGYHLSGSAAAPVFSFPGATATPTAMSFVLRYRLNRDETPFIINNV
jgi:hypothetical protein